ncbi:hypothetical protein CK203_095183 [Vitis vinifera]|uniref:Uncharacterized protein n=1 Tax=Vitis vinifera TaxID=29760 RepID=A0A438E108_VITVI|nr:hypothetical protein CK203_095183 [Vitis vinifera]
MCTTNEWREFNKDRSRKSLRDKVSILILTDRFWKKVGEVQNIMEPLVKVLKLIDQDKKPTLSIIYEAMDRSQLAIKASVKQWESIGKSLIEGGNVNYTDIYMLQVKLFVGGEGEFGSALTKKAINQSLPDEWIREGEKPILSSDNLDWLDKGLPTNEEGRETVHEDDGATNRRVSRCTSNATQERDVDSRRKGKTPRKISSSSSSDDADNEGSRRGGGTSGDSIGVVALVRVLEEIVALGAVIDPDSSSSTFSRNDFDRFPMMHPEGYSNTRTRASDSYGYDQSSSSNSIAYRGFGYYQYGVDPEQPSKPYFPDYGSSSQSSQPTYLSYEQLFQPYPHYGNYHPNLYTRRRTDDDDFEPPRHST